jgi:hypothetical protein
VLFGGADVIGEAPGGGDIRKYYQDTWVLNKTFQWTKMPSPSTPKTSPSTEEEETNTIIPSYPAFSLLIGLAVVFSYLSWRRIKT